MYTIQFRCGHTGWQNMKPGTEAICPDCHAMRPVIGFQEFNRGAVYARVVQGQQAQITPAQAEWAGVNLELHD